MCGRYPVRSGTRSPVHPRYRTRRCCGGNLQKVTSRSRPSVTCHRGRAPVGTSAPRVRLRAGPALTTHLGPRWGLWDWPECCLPQPHIGGLGLAVWDESARHLHLTASDRSPFAHCRCVRRSTAGNPDSCDRPAPWRRRGISRPSLPSPTIWRSARLGDNRLHGAVA